MGSGISLAAHYDMSVDNPPDLGPLGNRYPGTGANLTGHPNGIAGGICTKFDVGSISNINIGDIVELNAVERFSLAFWMSQDVLGVSDVIFLKTIDATHEVRVYTLGGFLTFAVRNGLATHAGFDHSTVTSAGGWLHIVCVFDGTQAVLVDRFTIYANGVSMALNYSLVGSIPAVTPDMSGADATIGAAASSFDGKLDDFRICSAALTWGQSSDLYNRTRKGIQR